MSDPNELMNAIFARGREIGARMLEAAGDADIDDLGMAIAQVMTFYAVRRQVLEGDDQSETVDNLARSAKVLLRKLPS